MRIPRHAQSKQTIPACPDFRSYLQQELLKRCRLNSSYSLRAFARSLRIEPSALSKILKGTRHVTPKMFALLTARLGMDPTEIERFRPPSGRLSRRSTQAATPLQASEYRQLTLDHFQVIADWYHYAILELTQTKGFASDTRSVARTLGITVSEANAAVERLQRLELLAIDPDTGVWRDQSGAVTTVGNEFTAAAFRKLQDQVLRKALVALEETPLEERDQSSMTMAISSEKLPDAKKLIRGFRRDLCALLKSGGSLDRVYHLGVSLYPVSKTLGVK